MIFSYTTIFYCDTVLFCFIDTTQHNLRFSSILAQQGHQSGILKQNDLYYLSSIPILGVFLRSELLKISHFSVIIKENSINLYF